MSLKIDRKQDVRTAHACTHNLADIPNGVTVSAADLVAGGILPEGAYIGVDEAGLYHLVKTAKLTEAAGATATTYKVAKGHHFKPGDFIASDAGAKAYAITSIDTSSDPTYDLKPATPWCRQKPKQLKPNLNTCLKPCWATPTR